MSRCISDSLPPGRPLPLGVRDSVDLGSMEYSAVTQPCPLFLRKLGTRSSMEAAQITLVLPTWIRQEPSANSWYPTVIFVSLA